MFCCNDRSIILRGEIALGMQSAFAQMFAICALCAAVETVTGENRADVRVVCGLAVALTAARLALQILQ